MLLQPIHDREQRFRHDAGFRDIHLIEQDHRIHSGVQFLQRTGDSLRDFGGSRSPVLGIEAIEFARRLARLDHQRLAIGERAPRGCLEKVHGVHPRQRLQRAQQLIALAVLTAKADWEYLAHAKRHEVVENRARRPRLRTHPRHVVNRQPSLDGNLRARRIDLQVAIEAKIADHGDAQGGIARSN